jgi:hypothetical protein
MFGKRLFGQRRSEKGEKTDLSAKDLAQRRERLRSKPLRSWPVYLLGPMAYVVACVVAVILVVQFTEGFWLAIGLTVVAFFVGHIPELFLEFKYSSYREEWKLVNGRSDKA